MAPPKTAQEELHQLAAGLYADRLVDTTTTQGHLLTQMALRCNGNSRIGLEREVERLKKALRRAYPEPNRTAQLWQGVLARCAHPEGHRQHLGLKPEQSRELLTRLRAELVAGDPVLSEFNELVAAARTADRERPEILDRAVALLTAMQPAAPVDLDALDEDARRVLRDEAARAVRTWGAVFDTALGEGRDVSDALLTLAETAVRGGFRAGQLHASLRARPSFGRSGCQSPKSIASHLDDPWIAAAAVLLVLRGVGSEELVDRTAAWAQQHLGISAAAVATGEVLLQAAQTLGEAGKRAAAAQALAQLWASGDVTRVWEAGLDLSITLAAQAFSHGELELAASVLDGYVRDELDGPYPGDPEEGWGASVDVWLYRLLCRALTDPVEVVGALREEWAEEVGGEGFMPRAWWLTGVLVQVLHQIGEPGQAANVASLAPRAVEASRTPAVRALMARLSEMTSSDAPGPDEANADRIAALTSELLALTLKDPKAADSTHQRILEGVVTTMRLAQGLGRRRAR